MYAVKDVLGKFIKLLKNTKLKIKFTGHDY